MATTNPAWNGTAWVPRMAQEYRLIRPDLPGLGHSTIPRGFEYSLANLATFVTRVMDKAGVESAHIIGAKTGGAVAMRFAADYPKRTRTLVVAGGPASPLAIADPRPSRNGIGWVRRCRRRWSSIGTCSSADRIGEGVKGLSRSLSKFDFAKEGVCSASLLPRW